MESYGNLLRRRINDTSGKQGEIMRLLRKDIEHITDRVEGCDEMLR